MIRLGDTMLLATVVSNKEAKPNQPFFPLSVDYQEKFAAVGRIPGNFFRRESKLSDYEVLVSRLVDRAVRPLFPDGYMNETQIMINLISADKDTMPDALVASGSFNSTFRFRYSLGWSYFRSKSGAHQWRICG